MVILCKRCAQSLYQWGKETLTCYTTHNDMRYVPVLRHTHLIKLVN